MRGALLRLRTQENSLLYEQRCKGDMHGADLGSGAEVGKGPTCSKDNQKGGVARCTKSHRSSAVKIIYVHIHVLRIADC